MSPNTPPFSLFSPPNSPSPSTTNPTHADIPMQQALAPMQSLSDSFTRRNLSGLRHGHPSINPTSGAYQLFPNYEQGWSSSSSSSNSYQFPMQYEATRNLGQEGCQTRRQLEFSYKLLTLMMSKDGIDLFENLLERSNSHQKLYIVQCLCQDRQRMVQAAKNKYGVNCLMELVRTIKTSNMLPCLFTFALREGLHELMVDPIGYRLVECCLKELDSSDKRFIYDAAAMFCPRLAKNDRGCLLLVECLKSSHASEQWRILRKLLTHSYVLAKNSKGNFIIQFALALGHDNFNYEICRSFIEHMEELAVNQYGSFVLQRCLESTGRGPLLAKLVKFDRFELERIATDRFGNYVLQTAMKESEDTTYHYLLVRSIGSLPRELENNMYAKKVFRVADPLLRRIEREEIEAFSVIRSLEPLPR